MLKRENPIFSQPEGLTEKKQKEIAAALLAASSADLDKALRAFQRFLKYGVIPAALLVGGSTNWEDVEGEYNKLIAKGHDSITAAILAGSPVYPDKRDRRVKEFRDRIENL